MIAQVPVIVAPLSHCYLDLPYAETSSEPTQTDRQDRVGLRIYAPTTVEESFSWEPAEVLGANHAERVAGIEAAIWAETITDFDDLTFLLLPRLPGVAQRAWSPENSASWVDHRDRLAQHAKLWTQDALEYFHASTVNWP